MNSRKSGIYLRMGSIYFWHGTKSGPYKGKIVARKTLCEILYDNTCWTHQGDLDLHGYEG